MSFKENLRAKIKLDRIFQSLVSTVREPPGRRWLDKELTKELLARTDFEHKKVRDLHLYIRPLKGEIMEVAVLDNELPIDHTTVDDVTLRKSPYWQQMFSIRNVRKIMNDHDVIASKGKESLKRLHASALALLDLVYTRNDLALLVEDGRQGLEKNSISEIQESLDLFFELLDFRPLFLEVLEPRFQSFARRKVNGGVVPAFEHLVLFIEENLSLGLQKGTFSPQSDSDLGWVMQYDLLRAGDGPAFVSFHARDTKRLHGALREGGYDFRQDGETTKLQLPEFAYLFLVRNNQSPTDLSTSRTQTARQR